MFVKFVFSFLVSLSLVQAYVPSASTTRSLLFVPKPHNVCRGFSRSCSASLEPVSVKPFFKMGSTTTTTTSRLYVSFSEPPRNGAETDGPFQFQLSAATTDSTLSEGTGFSDAPFQLQLSAATTDPTLSEDTNFAPLVVTAEESSIIDYGAAEQQSAAADYNRGLMVIGIVTLIFASHSPVIHGGLAAANIPPPVLLLNAVAAIVALMGLTSFQPLSGDPVASNDSTSVRAGLELGLFKTLGATVNLYGLSLTTANHGAFLIQLTTLIVPVVQGMMGVPLPRNIWTAVALAMSGVFLFTQGPGSGDSGSLLGDGLCVLAACFYALYDLRLNKWGDKVTPMRLITNKIFFQAVFSTALLFVLGSTEAMEYIQNLLASGISKTDMGLAAFVALWNGLLVNAGASLIQVRAQAAVGATRAQIVYATQPLMAAILSFFFLHETVGPVAMAGGALFLVALFLVSQNEEDAVCSSE